MNRTCLLLVHSTMHDKNCKTFIIPFIFFTTIYNIIFYLYKWQALNNIAVPLNLEWLYNKTSDLGIDYEKDCQIFINFDKCTLYNAHVFIGKYNAKM